MGLAIQRNSLVSDLAITYFLVGGIVLTIVELFLPRGHGLHELSLGVVLGMSFVVGIFYCLNEQVRIMKERESTFVRARKLLQAGWFLVAIGIGVPNVDSMMFRAFGLTLPFYPVLNWLFSGLRVGGIFTLGGAALSVRNRGPKLQDENSNLSLTKESLGERLGAFGIIMMMLAIPVGAILAVPGLILMGAGSVLYFGWLVHSNIF